MKARDHAFDNLRFFLILLVVVGHFLEIVNGEDGFPEMLRATLYLCIYAVHMPAFIFLNGYFAKFTVGKTLRFLLLYVLFQTAYILFSSCVLEDPRPLTLANPYWITWYLLVLFYDYLLIPLLDRFSAHKMWVIALTVLSALLVGYVDEIGFTWSLSRFIVFLPFFVVGYYLGRNRENIRTYIVRNKMPLLVFGMIGLWIMMWMTLRYYVTANFLYGSFAYAEDNQILLRVLHFIMAFAAIGTLLVVFITGGNRRIPFVTDVGEDTASVYLLHGFILRYLPYMEVNLRLIHVPFLAMAVIVITGNRFARKLFRMRLSPPGKMLPKVR